MFTDQHESFGMSPLREGNVGMVVQRRATRLQEVQNPSHDRNISILNNTIQTITLISVAVPLPIVKGALSAVAGILSIAKNTIANRDDFQEIVETCQMIGLVIWRATSQTSEHQLDDTVRRALIELKSSLDAIQDTAKAKAQKNIVFKVLDITNNQETIVKMKDELNRFLTLFNTQLNMSTNMKLDTLLAEFRAAVNFNPQTDSGEPDVLPSRPVVFFGRDNLVQSITQFLLDCRKVALIGPGGIGKSTIARAILNDETIASRFQDQRYFVRFDDMDAGQVNLGTFLDRIARTMGLVTSVDAHNMILRAISASDTLLVLDNAETFLDAPVDAGRIADVIYDFGARLNVAILITTRTTILPPNLDWVRLEVPILEESAACEAFQAYYPSIEKSILIKLLSSVEYHPLSINLLAQAALRNKWSPQELVTAWDCQRATLLKAGDGKSQSVGRVKEQDVLKSLKRRSSISTPSMGIPASWCGDKEQAKEHRPCRNRPRRKNIVLEARREGWFQTRKRVFQAAASVLGTAGDITDDVLFNGIPLLKFVPVPGLAPAADVLLKIWDALQLVETNRLQCLRLTNRCADILLSLSEHVKEAGDQVNEELQAPVTKLTKSFHDIQSFLIRQVSRPFLKCSPKRDEIQAEIRECYERLTDALCMLEPSIHIGALRSVQESEHGRCADQRAWLEILRGGVMDHKPARTEGDKIMGLKRGMETHDSEDLRAIRIALLRLFQIEREEMPEAIKTLQRALERVGDGGAGDGIYWGFIESEIDALRRMSRDAGITTSSLPSWTITRDEVDREQKIGAGSFSDVYRGTWHGRTVAIKDLAPTPPRELFVREVQVWCGLRHPSVLEFYGASSASGERPWFFVCAYMQRGSLVEFLKRMERGVDSTGAGAGASGRVFREEGQGKKMELGLTREGDLFRFMLEIAQGMEYLHDNGVLHGDLKAANVLVDDDVRCVISDFGQSQMKSEAYRISRRTPPRGTLRWQAPELMSGESQLALTPQMDVYAYAISCVEIVAMGKLPWPLAEDDLVRFFVLRKNARPALPPFSRFNTPKLQDLLRACWHHDPSVRPSVV